MLLLDLCQRTTGYIIYTDTDVVFKLSPTSLFEGIAQGKHFMHTCEGLMSPGANLILRKAHRYFMAKKSLVSPVIPAYFSKSMSMWNAGVLGFRSEDIQLLQKALQLTDSLYADYRKHIVEQFAFSYVLQEAGQLYAAEHCIHHYWNFKEFRPVLKAFFEANTLEQAFAKQQSVDPLRLELPKRRYEALPGWRRILRKLRGERWQMPPYTV